MTTGDVLKKRSISKCRVAVACCVVLKRSGTDCRVMVAGFVIECSKTISDVFAAVCVSVECSYSIGRVALADFVTKKCVGAVRCVVDAGDVAIERILTGRGIVVAGVWRERRGCIAEKRSIAGSGVRSAGRIPTERIGSIGGCGG